MDYCGCLVDILLEDFDNILGPNIAFESCYIVSFSLITNNFVI